MTLELFFSACLMFQLSPELACLRDLPNIGGIIIGRLRGVERESHTHHWHGNFIMVVVNTNEIYQQGYLMIFSILATPKICSLWVLLLFTPLVLRLEWVKSAKRLEGCHPPLSSDHLLVIFVQKCRWWWKRFFGEQLFHITIASYCCTLIKY